MAETVEKRLKIAQFGDKKRLKIDIELYINLIIEFVLT
ncbi:hypothetical protein GGR06_003814 [Bacteroides reticulotermitis]|jgi:hypothetical protein|uniref:Uncharacterized protein n=1 Tax=Bacteroides reticulotermitis TaxID=1133319 RepID=A0A840D5B6_9BACE|nr:hypothetical protein [Bacteroides reticulotermitis]